MSEQTIAACRHCDAAPLRRRKPGHPCSSAPGKWYCDQCGRHCDEPVIRERRDNAGPRGLAKRLLEADPDEVSAP